MATYNIKQTIDKYFQDNWSTTAIQYQGEQEPNKTTNNKFISLAYEPVGNSLYGMDGTSTGRIEYAGLYKVFCYAKNPTQAFILADAVKTFINGRQMSDIYIETGQDSGVNELGDGYHQTLCTFRVSQWA